MKKTIIILISLLLIACSTNTPTVSNENNIKEIPVKSDINSNLASTSYITPKNIDDYLFRTDCFYIDLRDPNLFLSEGHIAGFINIPFYGYITDFIENDNILFSMNKIKENDKVIHLGDNGSFKPIYEESIDLIYDIIPKDKYILAISTAGVESAYFLNLLQQIGYDPAKLINVGSFTNGMGEDIAYSSYSEAKYLVSKTELYDTNITYKLDTYKYTKIQD